MSLLLSNLLLLTFPPSTVAASAPQFVQVSGSTLTLNNTSLLLKGFNFYPYQTPWSYMWSQWDGPEVQNEIAQAALLGTNSLRVLVPYGNTYGWNDARTGQVNPAYLDELRQLVQIAGNFQMKVIITLFDFYGDFPATASAEEAANLTYLQGIVGAFKDDDRIVAWDLHNEPDNYAVWNKLHQPEVVLDWASRMRQALRQLDTNHLITIGAGSYENLWYTDGQGRSFISLSDFIGWHSYNAQDFSNEIFHLREHSAKPILLEETGWPTATSSNFNEAEQLKVYQLAIQSVTANQLAGMLGWTLRDFVPVGLINLEDYQNHYGLIRHNGTLKPAALVFRQDLPLRPLPSVTNTTTTLPLTRQPVDEGPRTVYFPQTDHYVATPLKELWRRAGGEEVFGLPLTDAIVEQNGDDGTPFGHNARIVQYFERARFEYYPDRLHEPGFGKLSHIYKYFYLVDFGPLGKELADSAILNSPKVTRTQLDNAEYQYFSDTGHDLSGPFLAFWQQHYGYKLFGAPISQPLEENGLVVQYLERVRLEYHSELKGQPGEVQISKLGQQSAQARGMLTSQPQDLPPVTFVERAFQTTWQRTDQPLLTGQVSRSWLWGPQGFATATESYAEAPAGQRLVQYFDKSRMELTNPIGDPDSKWYVTNGLLVKELIGGQLQLGDNRYEARQPAQIAVAGDPTEINLLSPTYATLRGVTTLSSGQGVAPIRTGLPVSATLAKNGMVGELDPGKAEEAKLAKLATNVQYLSETGHNIPDVFWQYLTQSRGTVLENGSGRVGDVIDWTFSVGYPLTEAYWIEASIAGVKRAVLVQAFERRILTYTPTNAPQYQVEMGNVGRHYYTWRYLSGQNGVYNLPPYAGG